MTLEDVKEFLRENLVIETEYTDIDARDVRVMLRFVGDSKPFASDIVLIPEPDQG